MARSPPDNADQASADPPETRLPEGEPPPPHVLIVDDNETNRLVCATLCKLFDYTFECASDGVEAVEAARQCRFDLILMDINMPRMDGVEAARTILALPGVFGTVPILAVTTDTGVQETRLYMEAGMVDVVPKPLNPVRLVQSMTAALAAAESAAVG